MGEDGKVYEKNAKVEVNENYEVKNKEITNDTLPQSIYIECIGNSASLRKSMDKTSMPYININDSKGMDMGVIPTSLNSENNEELLTQNDEPHYAELL